MVVAALPDPPMSLPPLPFRMQLIMLGNLSELITLAGFVMSPLMYINPNFLSVSLSCVKFSEDRFLVHHYARITARVCGFRSKIRCL